MGSGINNKINEFLFNPKNVKIRRNTRLEKCYGHVNIATSFKVTSLRYKCSYMSKVKVAGISWIFIVFENCP